MRILGVDEAGRGCVIGPLVIAGVLINMDSQSVLLDLGVKDSKLLSVQRRENLAHKIRELAMGIKLVKLSPSEIDKVVDRKRRLHKLNRLEAQAMATIIEALKPDIAIVDAADVYADRFKQHVTECLSSPVRVVSEHKADRNHPIVSAASIIAKTERDLDIKRLRSQYGDFGSGYMPDVKTKVFLETLLKKYGEYPKFVRRSWKPAKLLKARIKLKQAKLEDNLTKA
ncbi:MAG: ribonuclease HII [Candidatus Bathyarchaeota archaeon]|nr:MAG: ribonuclease HII [Candidatus Bathyarchaeota archaeon]